MRYGKDFGVYEIFVEPHKGESELDVLRAIAAASFELAFADGGFPPEISFREAKTLTDSKIKLSDESRATVLEMSEVGGRWCSTFVERVGKNHFCLSNTFQQYRGIPDGMLERARAILQTELDSR